ncbi:protein C3orf33 [Xylocopa sonorina]|uniref:protein C3orf33 n=1 Tax=Xylocopa sonorina TaxID=1818115 RepID=UPI00403AE4A2
MLPEKKSSTFERFIIFSETDAKTVKVFSYGIASLSLAIALYRIKPFAKFRKPSSIPSRFLHKKVQLQGIVKYIEFRCDTLLIVDHKPLIPLPRLNSKKYLPIKIAGLDVTNNGISWLQTIVNGKKISFIPLTKEKDYVNCIVSMQQDEERIQIGEELTKLGFAVAKEDPLKIMMKDQDVLNYQKRLIRAQKWAQRKRNGHWHFVKHPTLLWRIQQSLDEKMKSILPTFIARRLNI